MLLDIHQLAVGKLAMMRFTLMGKISSGLPVRRRA